MEQNSSSIMKPALTSGVYLGLVSIFLSIAIWALGLLESMGLFGGVIIMILSFVISFVLIFIFTKNYRNKELGGYISFGEAFKFAILAVIISTVITLIYTYIFHAFIAPDYLENLMAIMQQKTAEFMSSKGVSDAQMDATLEQFNEIPTMAKTLRQAALGGLIGGAVISLISSAIVRKKLED